MKKENGFYIQIVSSKMEQDSVCAVAVWADLSQSLTAGFTKLSERERSGLERISNEVNGKVEGWVKEGAERTKHNSFNV